MGNASVTRAYLSERDCELLAFAAEHKLVTREQVAALLGVADRTAAARLTALARIDCLHPREILDSTRVCHQISRHGLATIGSDLRQPRAVTLGCYPHDVGLGWLWLAARAGRLGPVREVIGERRLRSHDAREDREGAPLGVRLGGVGWRGGERLHYPDLMLATTSGQRVAVELELSRKGSRRRQRILAGYAADGRVDAVLYLVENRAVGRSIQRTAHELGLSDLVHVQLVRLPGTARGTDRAGAVSRPHGRHRAGSATPRATGRAAGR